MPNMTLSCFPASLQQWEGVAHAAIWRLPVQALRLTLAVMDELDRLNWTPRAWCAWGVVGYVAWTINAALGGSSVFSIQAAPLLVS